MSQSEFLNLFINYNSTEILSTLFTLKKLIFLCVPTRLAKAVRGAIDRNGPVNFTQAELDMYLSACRFLDTSLAFPPEKLPIFQM